MKPRTPLAGSSAVGMAVEKEERDLQELMDREMQTNIFNGLITVITKLLLLLPLEQIT